MNLRPITLNTEKRERFDCSRGNSARPDLTYIVYNKSSQSELTFFSNFAPKINWNRAEVPENNNSLLLSEDIIERSDLCVQQIGTEEFPHGIP